MVERYDKLVDKLILSNFGAGETVVTREVLDRAVAEMRPYEIGRILVRCIEDDRLDREREAAAEKQKRKDELRAMDNGRITYNDRELP